MSTTDEAIRALCRGVAQATVELVCEQLYGGGSVRHVYSGRREIAEAITEVTMLCAEDDPESEVHAVRELARASAPMQEPLA